MSAPERGERAKVVIVDDDPLVLESWRAALSSRFDVSVFRNPLDAERFFERERVDLALLDLQMPGRDGLTVLRGLKKVQPAAEVIILTGHGSISLAIEATRAGAYDFLTKPVEDPEAVALRIEAALERKRLAADNVALRSVVDAFGPETFLVGESEPMRRLRALIERLANSPGPVLIVGESGTGKELVARALHAQGARTRKPFVAVNCAAVSETLIDSELFGHERGAFTGAHSNHKGLFEAAHGGVLFLDEIGDVPAATQVRLLRALQEGEVRSVGSTKARTVDVRVVAATNVDLTRAMAEGRFRQDLYYRLSTFRLELPSLRERGDDVTILADHLLRRSLLRSGMPPKAFTPDALGALRAYGWPGNVRELRNVVEYAVTLCEGDRIDTPHLPPHVLSTSSRRAVAGDASPSLLDDLEYRTARERFERRYLNELVTASGGNLSEAARRSGIDRSNLRRMLRRLGIGHEGSSTPVPGGDVTDDD